MPDVVLMRVVEILGTPPPANHPDQGSNIMAPASFLSELLCMAQVCRRWTKAVRGSDDVWKAVCMWR